jgi:hypothetical protein
VTDMNYTIEEGQLRLDQSWQDQTVNVLIPQNSPVAGANLVISREQLPLGMTLSQRFNQQQTALSGQLPDFKLVLGQVVEKSDHVLHVMEFEWKKDGKNIYQLVAMRAHAGDRLLCFTATVPGGHEASLRQRMVEAITSFEAR